MILAALDQPEVAAICRSLRDDHHAPWTRAIERAIGRADLPAGSDAQLIIDTIFGTVANRLFRTREPVADDFLVAVVDLVLIGARYGGARRGRATAPG